MGTINYMTSRYITMGVKPYYFSDFENDADFMEEVSNEIKECGGTVDSYIQEYINICYEADIENIEFILSRYSFYYFHVAIEAGYYEGFTLDIENNFSVAFDCWEDKRAAQKEITKLKQCLLECAGCGLVACHPGWCTGYEDYKGTCKAISAAIKDMREEVKNAPTWAQYEKTAKYKEA